MKKSTAILLISLAVFLTACNQPQNNEQRRNISQTLDSNSNYEVSQNFSEILDNPIDEYFLMMSKKIVPTSTKEMVMFEILISEAWKAEMENCYEIIRNKTSDENVRQLLDNEMNSYIEYIKNKAEIDIYYGESDAFNGGDGTSIGSLSRLDRVCIWSDGYKQKTAELFYRIEQMDINPVFIFDKERYYEQLKESFFESHPKAFE